MESLDILRSSFNSGLTRSIEYRKQQLKALFKMIEVYENDICDALKKDMNKSSAESKLSEILPLKQELSYLVKNLDHWLANEKVSKSFITLNDDIWIQRQPFGVALCIGTWNYPVILTLGPLSGLIAAGNCVILKPSELAIHTEKLLMELIPLFLDQRVCKVELGGAERTGEILKERFDYIVFTGSTKVGKIVMKAASEHLTPVLLELGGKSPAYVDKNVRLAMAAKRLMWGKFLNCGQTCISPDYILCHVDVKEKFIQHSVEVIEQFYTITPKSSPDYPRIINDRHFKRLMTMLDSTKGKVIVGGDRDEESKYISPTVVVLDSVDDALMESEIFGPILPILIVDSTCKAIEIINKKEKALSLYVFSNDKAVHRQFEIETSSGSLTINDCVVHFAAKELPFGGVGESGMGCYHGRFSIEQFTHKRAMLHKDTSEIMNEKFRYPPFNKSKEHFAEWGLKSNIKDSRSCMIL